MGTERQPKIKFADLYPQRTDGKCRCGCGLPITGRRKTWASDECSAKAVERFGIRAGFSDVIRRAVFRRDGGICKACGMDAHAERLQCESMGWGYRWEPIKRRLVKGELTPEELRQAEEKRRRYMLGGFPPPQKSWWQADHIVEVVRGGGGCDLDNFQTLCDRCHKIKTAKLAADRALERREAKRNGTPQLGLAT